VCGVACASGGDGVEGDGKVRELHVGGVMLVIGGVGCTGICKGKTKFFRRHEFIALHGCFSVP